MATISERKVCLVWSRVVAAGGIPANQSWWNGDSRADPDTLAGGVAFDLGGCLNENLVLMACGTGDAQIAMNFGQFRFSSPLPMLPKTYFPGWPNASGSPDAFDPAAQQGSGTLTDNNQTVTFVSTAGVAQSLTGWGRGRFYVEYILGYDIFSQGTGAGPMRMGSQIAYAETGQKNISDPIGGVMVNGGDVIGHPVSIYALGSEAVTDYAVAPSSSIMALAIALIPRFNAVPQLFQAQRLPQPHCCPDARLRGQALSRRLNGTF